MTVILLEEVKDVYFSEENVNGDISEDLVKTTFLLILMPFKETVILLS